MSHYEGESRRSKIEQGSQHVRRRPTLEQVIRRDPATRQRLPRAGARTRQNYGAVARHTVNSTPWANGNSPEKLTVFVARRM